jgi:hypothetical protein
VANKFIPIAELKETTAWVRLSPRQRELVTKYVELDHDREATVKAIYTCGTSNSVRTTINRAFGHADVKAFLALHFGESDADTFKAELKRIAASPRKVSNTRLQILKLMARVNGLDVSALEPEPEGKIVAEKEIVRDGRRLKTTVVDLGEAVE